MNTIYAEFNGEPVRVIVKPYSCVSIDAKIHDMSYGGYPYKVEAEFIIDPKEFAKIKRHNQLGQLFGIDLSNEVYRLTNGKIPASNPSVDYSKPARKGIKTLKLTYFFRDHDTAEALGFEVIRLKSGEVMTKRAWQTINLLKRGAK